MYNEVLESDVLSPTPFTFASYALACSNLVEDDDTKNQMARVVLESCTTAGLCDDKVQEQFVNSFPAVWQEALAKHELADGQIIPESWQLGVSAFEERALSSC